MSMSQVLAAAAITACINAQSGDYPPNCDDFELVELTMDEMEELYTKVTGPYCEENAFTDPMCVHRRDELLALENQYEWTPFEFEKFETYCSRFPDACGSANRIRVNPETRFLVDSFGRTTLLHGVNAIYKIDPYIPSQGDFDPQNSLNDEDIANLKKWGMNFVRLGVMWEGVERTEDAFDTAYLDQVEGLINKLGEAGIYTLVDAH